MNDSTSSSRHRRRFSRGKIAVVVLLVVAVIGYGGWKFLGGTEEQSQYVYATVQTGNIEDLVTATGTLEPRDYVDVGAQVSGQIQEILVEVGDQVKAGDRLATIDATTARARVDAQRASLTAARISLETQYENLTKAKRDHERQQNLLLEDATTKEQAANAETAYLNAQRQIEQSKAQIAQQEANMRVDENNLRYTEIVAPIDGTVMSIAVKEGQTINATQSAPNVLRLADLNTMTVRTDVSEADVSKLKDGMTAYFTTLGAGGNRRWYGTLKRIEPTPKVQNSVVLYPVLFDVENEGSSLMPSMTAQVFFVVAEARNVLTMPMAALQQGQQIAREMAAKEGEGGAGPGGMPGMMGRGEGNPAAPGGSAPATQAGAGADAGNGASPGAGGNAGEAGGRDRRNAGDAGSAGAGGAPGAGQGGGGMRPGGGFGNFNPENLTPEQRERFRQMREQFAAGGGGNFGPGGPGMGGFGPGMGAQRQGQPRRGVVMVHKGDDVLEQRQVVIGVTDRVYGQVLEGLEEGEVVVVGRREDEAAAAAAAANQNNNNFRPGGFRPF